MRRALAILVLTFVALVGSIPAAAGDASYSDIGFDQNDAGPRFVDVRNTTRTIERDAKGRHWLSIEIRSWEHLRQSWFLTVRLDTRGGRRSDAVISFFNAEGPGYCSLTSTTGDGWTAAAHQRGDLMKCRFRLRTVGEIDKRIRWRIKVDSSSERAPNVGWYV